MLVRDKLLLPAATYASRLRCRLLLGGILATVMLVGCQKRDAITRYTVRKPPPIEPLARINPHRPAVANGEQPTGEPTDRTLGAIVPLVPQGWFFKLTGPKDAVAAHEEVFTAFLKSVRFAPDGKPHWTLPAGWQERPGNQIRYATLVIPGGDKPLEVTVTALPNSGTDDEDYLLVNVNRWRGQMRLPPIAKEQLAGESSEIKLDGATATLVNIVGHAADTMGRPPFFSGARDGN
ncbi:MAG: hypothetical protein WD063_12850 [Pirellulales bacterium]